MWAIVLVAAYAALVAAYIAWELAVLRLLDRLRYLRKKYRRLRAPVLL